MSIDTIYESLNLFFRKNEDVLKLPIEVDFGKDVRNALSNRWAQYVDLIKNHNCLEECIPIIEKSIKLLCGIYTVAMFQKRKTRRKSCLSFLGSAPAVRGAWVPPPAGRLHLVYFRLKRPNVKFCCLKQRAVFPYNRYTWDRR